MKTASTPFSLSALGVTLLSAAALFGCNGGGGGGGEQVVLPDPTKMFEWNTREKLVGFSHSTDIYATEAFRAGSSVPFQKIAMPGVTYQYGGATRNVDDYMKRQKVAGLLVIKNGKIALERYADGVNENTIWESKSVGKSVLSTLIGIALKEGSISSLNDPVEKYVPELKGSAYESVTLQNMLRMASGVAWTEHPYEDKTTDAYYILAHCIGAREEGCTLKRMKSLKRAVDADGKPVAQGTVWNYNTGEAFLTGLVLQRATGKTIAKYLEEKLWKPAQMEKDGAWISESNGVSFGGIGFNATLRDYGRFAQFVMNEGHFSNGSNLLPGNWVEDSTTWFAPSAIPDFADNGQYGYMWWFYPAWDDGINKPSPLVTSRSPDILAVCIPLPAGGCKDLSKQNTTSPTPKALTGRTSDWTFSAYGIFGQMIAINPAENVIVVQWSTWDNADPVELDKFPDNPYNEESVFVNAVIDALRVQ